jgi:hypothetical protein
MRKYTYLNALLLGSVLVTLVNASENVTSSSNGTQSNYFMPSTRDPLWSGSAISARTRLSPMKTGPSIRSLN